MARAVSAAGIDPNTHLGGVSSRPKALGLQALDAVPRSKEVGRLATAAVKHVQDKDKKFQVLV
jgi:hypothetical protein